MAEESLSKTEAVTRYFKERNARINARKKGNEMRWRAEQVGFSVAAAVAVSTLPIWVLERNPSYKYIDEAQEIETEAVYAVAAVAGGIGAFIADVPYATPALVAGLVAGGNYLSEVTRQRARTEIAEEAALAAAEATSVPAGA
jgi:cation transport ATPase